MNTEERLKELSNDTVEIRLGTFYQNDYKLTIIGSLEQMTDLSWQVMFFLNTCMANFTFYSSAVIRFDENVIYIG